MYDRTGLSTKCTLMKTGFKNLRTGTVAKFRPFVDALMYTVTSAVLGVGGPRTLSITIDRILDFFKHTCFD